MVAEPDNRTEIQPGNFLRLGVERFSGPNKKKEVPIVMKRLFTNYFTGLAIGVSVLGTAAAQAAEGGAIYTMDNSAGGNHVLSLQRAEDGGLSTVHSVATGGTGSGAGLSSQGAVVLSQDGRWLFVCNVGSSEISVMSVSDNGLALTDKTASGGKMPVSLALRQNLLYVLNAGGGAGDTDDVTAFTFDNGKLVALPDSTRALSGTNTGPAQVSFTRDGATVVVTERLTNLIDTFAVADDGLLANHKTFQSVGATPFGFDVGRQNRIFVSEAAGSASSYHVADDGDLAVISGAVATKQAAPCWLITSHDGRFVYTANAGAGSISGFEVNHDGSLHLSDADGRTGVTGTGSHPVDMTQSHDGRFLYSLANGNGTINAFRVRPNGSLQPVMVVSGIPTSAAGLAGR
jgi:6-phosphogluconolactonase